MVMAIALYVSVQRFYYVAYEFRRLVLIVIVTALLFLLFLWIGLGGISISSFIIKALLLFAFPILLFVSKFFDSQELATVRRLFHLA
jgi:hypothetical protein